jgi:cytochrome P450/ferredoxin-NADP reductase
MNAMNDIAAFLDSITLDMLEENPYPIYARLRREAPVAFVPAAGVWFATRFEDCEAIGTGKMGFVGAKDHPTLQRVFGSPNVLTSDGEVHDELRKGVDPRLQPNAVNDMVDAVVRPIARGRLEAIRANGRAELMGDYLEPVSVEALRHVMGLDDLVGADTLRRWFHDLNLGIANFGLEPEGFAIADAASAEIARVIRPKLEHLAAHPDDSMMSHMLWAGRTPEQGARPFEFITPSLRVILLGGMQEPGHAAGSTVMGLFSRPEQWRMLSENPDEYILPAINEGLRWIAPIGSVERQASQDVDLHGQHIAAGSIVQVVLGSANRDETRFDDPDSFDMLRAARAHQAFGNGVHFCAGHFFARKVEEIMLQEMVAALPGLRQQPDSQIEVSGWVFRAPKKFPVEWQPVVAAPIRTNICSTAPVVTPAQAADTRILTVMALRLVAEDVIEIELRDPEGRDLPAWEAGAHVDLWLQPGRAAQYSLCGDPSDRKRWLVAVFRESASRGGSRFVHEELRPGMRLHVGGPRNHFALEPGAAISFVAGGIGVTPILALARAARAAGREVEVAYCGRRRTGMAYAAEVADLGGTLHARDEGPRADIDALVRAAATRGAEIYVCGGDALREAVEERAGEHGVTVRSERFSGVAAHREGDFAFDVTLARRGCTLHIPADRSILDVLDDEGIEVRRSCQEGNCGSCETALLAGDADHRDVLLTAKQRAANDRIMLCVSRAIRPDDRLVLDL